MYRCQMYFADPADQGALEEMRLAGLAVANNIDKSINPGIQVIKKLLRVPGEPEPKLFVADECTPLIQEFQMYHFKLDTAGEVTEIPEEKNDHWLDALRYALMMLLGKATLVLSGDGLIYDKSPLSDHMGNYSRVPTAGEFASRNNIRFNEEVDKSKLGKLTNQKSNSDPDDGDDGIGGDGGFLWSF